MDENEQEKAILWTNLRDFARALALGTDQFVHLGWVLVAQDHAQESVVDLQAAVVFDEAKFSELIHEEINLRARGSHHLRIAHRNQAPFLDAARSNRSASGPGVPREYLSERGGSQSSLGRR